MFTQLEQVRDDPLARHVVTENHRAPTSRRARLRHVNALGPLPWRSHASLRDDYAVSTPELDLLVDLLVEHGAIGARLTGAGFGGCVVALVQRNHADDCAARDVAAYSERTGLDGHAPSCARSMVRVRSRRSHARRRGEAPARRAAPSGPGSGGRRVGVRPLCRLQLEWVGAMMVTRSHRWRVT